MEQVSTNKKRIWCLHVPENEDDIEQQLVESSPLLHCLQQHQQLSLQGRQEAKQPLKPQQTQCVQPRAFATAVSADPPETKDNTTDQLQDSSLQPKSQ